MLFLDFQSLSSNKHKKNRIIFKESLGKVKLVWYNRRNNEDHKSKRHWLRPEEFPLCENSSQRIWYSRRNKNKS
jgi:hypothetical protein